MMADFVDQYVADEMLERLALLGPFGEDRLAEQADPVGQRARRFDAALADRDAFIDAGQVERMLDAQLGEQRVVGIFVDLQHDIGEMAGERLGQPLPSHRARSPRSPRPKGGGRSAAPWLPAIEAGRPDAASLPLGEAPLMGAPSRACGAVAEWSKALAWKVSIRQNRIEGSNPSRSAICWIASAATALSCFRA